MQQGVPRRKSQVTGDSDSYVTLPVTGVIDLILKTLILFC